MFKTWNELEIGTETGTIDFTITKSMVEDYYDIMDIGDGLFGDVDSVRQEIAPPELITKSAAQSLFFDYILSEIGRTVRAKQQFIFLKPVPVGSRLTATGRIAEKYERRGKQFVVFEATFLDEAGEPTVVDRRTNFILPADFEMQR